MASIDYLEDADVESLAVLRDAHRYAREPRERAVGQLVGAVVLGKPERTEAICMELLALHLPAEHVHQWGSTGGAWQCATCPATKPRIIGPGV